MSNLTDYTRLITPEHQGKPNFAAVLAATLQPLVDGQNQLASIPGKFDLDAAVGEQLDFVGQWVGIARTLRVPIPGVYFSFNIVNLGVNEGIWFNPDNPAEGVVTMDDGTYRLMIRSKIAANIWDGSMGHANAMLAVLFPGGAVELEDNFDMTYSINISGDAPSTLFRELVTQGYIPFSPAGVRLV